MVVELIEAVVQAGSVETTYVRAGQGAPVILLTRRATASLLADPLFLGLVARFRVIVPTLPAPGVDTANWLRDMMDGLGCQECSRVLLDVPQLSDTAISSALSALENSEEH